MYSKAEKRYTTLKLGCSYEPKPIRFAAGRQVLARLRAEKGITQEVLSGLSDIGRTHLSALERGERKPTLETLYRISNALDMPMSVIVAEIEKEIRENS